MVEKRKLPARGASRQEQAAKKRALTPPQASETPEPASGPEEPAKPPLPTSIQAGKPLPTVDRPQPEDLPSSEFQSVQESGVLSESIQRSRLKWISDGLFEKYWTKPVKRKGVIIEDPNNPPKDSMVKLGHVTITIEPHVFEATMFAVKDPKAPPSVESKAEKSKHQRPVLQYGPPGGVFVPPPPPPPPPAPKESSATPAPAPAPAANGSTDTDEKKPAPDDTSKASTTSQPARSQSPAAPQPAQPMRPPPAPRLPGRPDTPPPAPPKSATDPVIVTLAERASEDSSLRDLMKKVAVGDAKADELRIFQQVIDEITQEHKRSISGQQGPPADRLFVDGRSVQYFAEEVRHILDIVLRANPRQRSADLRPPPGSDRLIVLLVMKALDDTKTRDQIRRIADNRAVYQDTNELKATLEALKEKVVKENSRQSSAAPLASPLDARAGTAANGTPSTPTQPGIPPQSPVQSQTPSAALRSKGPPPNPKLDISAIVFEFAAGNGDRYLFPKFSILEYLPSPGTTTGQQGQQQQQQQQLQTVLASFLIVRRGSSNENGVADPALDYYQPVTIRISAPYGNSGAGGSHGRLLDNLAKVVARPGEVRAYMEDIMDTMTRAEYVLLAMRLPRNEAAAAAAAAATDSEGHENSSSTNEAAAANNGASRQGHRRGGLLQAPSMMQPGGRGPSPGLGGGSGSSGGLQQPPAMGGVLWTMKPAPPTAASTQQSGMRAPDEDERYQAMIASVNRGPPEVV